MHGALSPLINGSLSGLLIVTGIVLIAMGIAVATGQVIASGRFLKIAAIFCGLSMFNSAVEVLGTASVWLVELWR